VPSELGEPDCPVIPTEEEGGDEDDEEDEDDDDEDDDERPPIAMEREKGGQEVERLSEGESTRISSS